MAVFLAVLSGNEQRLKRLVQRGADLTEKHQSGLTPLAHASQSGKTEMVRILLEAGVDPNSDPCFPLHSACSGNNIDALKLLLAVGADVSRVNPLTGTALMVAAVHNNIDIVKTLLSFGADVNGADANGRTALHQAAGRGLVAIASVLLQNGADICATCSMPYVPDYSALELTPLAVAAQTDRIPMIRYLIEEMERQGVTNRDGGFALYVAVLDNRQRVVELLVERGWNKIKQDEGSWSPLLFAAYTGRHKMVKSFHGMGADLEATFGDSGETALHLAAAKGHVKVVKYLIRCGANLEAKTRTDRETTLHAALQSRENSKTLKLLLNAGANIFEQTRGGQNFLHLAASSGFILALRIALRRGVDPHAKTVRGLTPLALAASAGELKSIEVLLRWGAEINTKCKKGSSALHLAATQGHWRVADFLVENGASLDSLDSQGRSPLQRAAKRGHQSVVNILMEKQAKDDLVTGKRPHS